MKLFSKSKDDDFIIEEPENQIALGNGTLKREPSHLLTPEEVLKHKSNPFTHYDGKAALESLKARMKQSADLQKDEKSPKKVFPGKKVTEKIVEDTSKTLLEKCKAYITDENGKDTSNAVPLYKLESVADILEGHSKDTISRLAEQYDITEDDLTKVSKTSTVEPETKTLAQDEEVIKINTLFQNVQSSVPFSVSEVNIPVSTPSVSQDLSNTATITFTPVTESDSQKPKVVITNNTQSIDLTSEIAPLEDISSSSRAEQVTLEKSEFEDFIPEDEIKNENDTRKHIRRLSILKRRSFLILVFSVLLTLALGFMKLPFMTGLILGKTKSSMIICTALAFGTTLLNIEMFLKLPKIFSKKAVPDVCAALASLCVLAYAVMGIITGEIVLDMLLLLGIILTARALGKFRKDSYTLSNLKQLAKPGQKNAVRLLDDATVTFAMAKNSVEGDTLIAAPQKCDHVADYIKYSTFGTFLNGKLPIISTISIILSVATGFAAAYYYGGVVHGLYAAASIQCFACLPNLFFISDFPLYSAAKKLNKKNAMIAGQMGASHIEMANALVLNSSDIFPSGTVTLHQIKVLSDNNLDQTILRAASLTECLNSPLAPIFKKIAGDSNIVSLPDSDTIKYEERMGISGWVDDELLFIGNRTLMEAHGITVPDIEIDRKILRNGYFPVYVANTDNVCALLVVQYTPDADVSHELHRLTKIGVTLLVNNTDPNISAEMVCDYLGLYEDSVMILSNAGYHMYKNTTLPKETCSAPACFKWNNLMLARIINCANKIRRSNTILTILYVISAILGIIIFTYSSFTGSDTIIGSTTVLLYSVIATAVTYLLYLIEKP